MEADFELTEDAIERGRLLFARPFEFLRGVARLDQLPAPDLPEVAMAGRSNVGKSSLVNALTGRTALARISNTPGRTQEINLFELGGRLRLADLPGYGYAKAPKAKVEAWTDLVFAYLRGRPNLRLVCLLIDGRHGLKPADEAAMRELGRAAVPYLPVLTKTDLVGRGELAEREADLAALLRTRPGALTTPIRTSSRSQAGIPHLRARLAALAAQPVAVERESANP